MRVWLAHEMRVGRIIDFRSGGWPVPDNLCTNRIGKWDAVTHMILPMGESTVIAYDAFTGNSVWQQDARETTTWIEFDYHRSGDKRGLIVAWKRPSPICGRTHRAN